MDILKIIPNQTFYKHIISYKWSLFRLALFILFNKYITTWGLFQNRGNPLAKYSFII